MWQLYNVAWHYLPAVAYDNVMLLHVAFAACSICAKCASKQIGCVFAKYCLRESENEGMMFMK